MLIRLGGRAGGTDAGAFSAAPGSARNDDGFARPVPPPEANPAPGVAGGAGVGEAWALGGGSFPESLCGLPARGLRWFRRSHPPAPKAFAPSPAPSPRLLFAKLPRPRLSADPARRGKLLRRSHPPARPPFAAFPRFPRRAALPQTLKKGAHTPCSTEKSPPGSLP